MGLETAVDNASAVSLWDMFYLANPHRHMYKDVKYVPQMYAQVNCKLDNTDHAL